MYNSAGKSNFKIIRLIYHGQEVSTLEFHYAIRKSTSSSYIFVLSPSSEEEIRKYYGRRNPFLPITIGKKVKLVTQ